LYHRLTLCQPWMSILVAFFCMLGFSHAANDTTTVNVHPSPTSTKASVTINGTVVDYTVTTGQLQLTKEDGTVKANVFYIAYTRNNVKDAAKRPVTFSFNGGPGSSSVWLHLGVLGPRRVNMATDGSPLPPPCELVDNEYSWLDLTDLVFIDPVSTGYSRATDEKTAGQDFHGYRQDIESVGEFIRRYINDNQRWGSPKYLIGESYGTTRASGLSEHLQARYGMYLNGVILVSAVLNFQTISFDEGNDLPFISFLPTYAATAWYHKKLSADLQQKSVQDVVREVTEFARNEYAIALMAGSALQGADRTKLVQRISRYTGLSAEFIERSDLRINIFRFCAELLRSTGQQVGRFDGRYTGPLVNQLSEFMEQDPSYHPAAGGAFSTCINDYLSRELKVTTLLPYEVLTGRVWPWDYGNVKNEYLNVAPALRNAIVTNPALRVWVLCGYYDLATPVYGAEYTIQHLGLPESLRGNISLTYYDAGHMMYLLRSELERMRQGALEFYGK